MGSLFADTGPDVVVAGRRPAAASAARDVYGLPLSGVTGVVPPLADGAAGASFGVLVDAVIVPLRARLPIAAPIAKAVPTALRNNALVTCYLQSGGSR